MPEDKVPRRPARATFQNQLVQGSRDAINRSYKLLRRTERLVRPGLPILPKQVFDKDSER
ncbi:hypothetical protein RFM26_10755 [Mesorhizobium sp. VK23B]|uniref:Uncharacterized protein n=1 Tax=Mesorhizobium dulcispinae TaxID=3072316 RepID=A0ABU4XB00_9HYPH|nr:MULTISPECIES: hypothetical protein [unclassified Mesorhizobium]MDX8466161.1 hypothetical protein [Mesorhizobium sp. VK23B]MDX8471972.1 hypothetical protein [Mesorhizobium sp. VK23A]